MKAFFSLKKALSSGHLTLSWSLLGMQKRTDLLYSPRSPGILLNRKVGGCRRIEIQGNESKMQRSSSPSTHVQSWMMLPATASWSFTSRPWCLIWELPKHSVYCKDVNFAIKVPHQQQQQQPSIRLSLCGVVASASLSAVHYSGLPGTYKFVEKTSQPSKLTHKLLLKVPIPT